MIIYKRVVLAVTLLACVQAGYIGEHEDGYGGGFDSYGSIEGGYDSGHDGGHDGGHEEHDHHPKYKFSYAVHDPHTGDEKQHFEERDGDAVKGSYTFKEADGTTRVVDYKADKHNGFTAVVHKIGEPKHQPEIGYDHHRY